ncbi:MAG: hypothetical protein QM504_14180 [Pseudomonadota bacterium]
MFKKIILPGLIFQSTMIGGGYATGRELIEFFLKLGPSKAILAMCIATAVLSTVTMIAFEYARQFKLYDYKSFFNKLLGPAWPIFEFAYLALIILILSVLGAATGELFSQTIHIKPIFGIIILMVTIGGLTFFGGKTIEKFLSAWSVVLYLTYFILIIWSFALFGDKIAAAFTEKTIASSLFDMVKGGMTYAGYNIVVFCAVLFIVNSFENRSQALWAGLLCGPLAMIPGFLLLVAMSAHYPEIIDQPLPISYLLERINAQQFLIVFQIVIFGTFIETGTALMHSVNERIATGFKSSNKQMPTILRPVIAILFLIFAILLADAIGLVSLIGQGYTYSTYVFYIIVIIPILVKGIGMFLRQYLTP